MRYFTKDWYNDTVLAEMCFQVKHSPKAAKFNEKYFQSLYNAQKSWFVKNEKRTAKYTGAPFDAAAAEAKFEAGFKENLEYVTTKIPADILANVADVRLLAIGTASYDVTQAIVRFCGQVNRRCEAVKSNYEEENEKVAERIGWYKVNTLNFITNAPIIAAHKDGDDFVITTSAEYTDIACNVTLKNAKIVRCDQQIIGSSTLFLELLPTENENELELNLLCSDGDGKSCEFSAIAEDIEIEELENNQSL